MNTKFFSNWIVEQLRMKGWSQSDLARTSGLTRAAISNYVAGKISKPDEGALRSIAQAFGYPPETVYRVAGILPPIPPEEAEWEIWRENLRKLDPDVRARFRRQLEAEVEYEEEQHKLQEAAKRKKTGPLPSAGGM